MYTGEIGFCTDNSGDQVTSGKSDAEEIYEAASQLSYTVLKRRAVTFLRETLFVENVMARLTRAFIQKQDELREMYQDYFYEHWNDILKSGVFEDFHKKVAIDFAIQFGKWFSWGMFNRVANDTNKRYDPKAVLEAFTKVQCLLQERIQGRVEQVDGGPKNMALH